MPTKTRTITLTDRAPVRIVEEEWPIIASAKDWDGEFDFQAPRTWAMRVRQHADGRAIVYATYATQFRGEVEWRGGELLDAGADIAAAIRRVGEDGAMPEHVIRECIADLPAVEV